MTPGHACGVAFAVLMLALVPRDADACSCVFFPEACARIAEADAVFEATVSWTETKVREDMPDSRFLFTERIVHLRDVRAWRGELSDVIVTGMGGGDCGYAFEPGRRYMIEAHRRPDGRLVTGICSKTQPLEWAGGFREYVESLSAPPQGGHVWGRVVTTALSPVPLLALERPSGPGPLAGATVTIAGPVQRTATVGADGLFSFAGLPEGAYALVTSPPPGRSDLEPLATETVTLDGAHACRDLTIAVRF